MPYTTDVTVRVTTDVEIEPVAEYRPAKDRELILHADGVLRRTLFNTDAPWLIVTPKEPAVSEPEKYTIPLEVTQSIYEKYEGAVLPSGIWIGRLSPQPPHTEKVQLEMIPRTPRYEYPAELSSPEVWGIAANDCWDWWIYYSQPQLDGPDSQCFNSEDPTNIARCFSSLRLIFPNVQMPTPEQCSNDWRQSCFKNPKWKGE